MSVTGLWHRLCSGGAERLGIPRLLAEIHSDHLDWHQLARLVPRGCPPQLALRIVS